MEFERLGERAVILRNFPFPPALVSEMIKESEHKFELKMIDIVPCKSTVGVYFQDYPQMSDFENFVDFIKKLDFRVPTNSKSNRKWEIPVCYELGEDHLEVAKMLKITLQELIQLHSESEVTCFSVGFCPGFGYCEGIHEKLSGVPRRPMPRPRVEAGSVGLTGNMTAIYPLARPGGWRIIGRTPLVIVDVDSDFFPLKIGDSMTFKPISMEEFQQLLGHRLAN